MDPIWIWSRILPFGDNIAQLDPISQPHSCLLVVDNQYLGSYAKGIYVYGLAAKLHKFLTK